MASSDSAMEHSQVDISGEPAEKTMMFGGEEVPSHLVPYSIKERERLIVHSSSATTSSLVNARKANMISDPSDLVALATFIESAESYAKATVSGKLSLICEQIRGLQAQAKQILEEAKRDVDLSRARCNFQRKPGHIYHLYRKPLDNGELEVFFSMLSPAEWGTIPKDNEYLGSYRLEYDMSFTPVEDIRKRDQKMRLDPVLLGLDSTQAASFAKALEAPKY